MKISIINLGGTQEKFLKEGITLFEKRLRHYTPFEMIYLKEPKNAKNQPEIIQKTNEGKIILSAIEKVDFPVLLDVKGKQLNSLDFSKFLQNGMNRGYKNMGFIIGGPYGFSDEVYGNVTERLSLSSMTYSHQFIRLMFIEQLYRAFTIIKGEPYHHE